MNKKTLVNHMGLQVEGPVYRIGNVDGPFLPERTYVDGSPRPRELWAGKPKYWVVRVAFGPAASIFQDRHFLSYEDATEFWDSLPPY